MTAALLPAYLDRWERHKAHEGAGTHPEITDETGYYDVVEHFGNRTEHLPHGVFFNDGKALIGFIEEGRCPVCGDVGSLRLDASTKQRGRALADRQNYAFVRFADNRSDESPVKRMEANNVVPIVCWCDHTRCYVGAASESAAEDYLDWKSTRSQRDSFKTGARRLARRKAYPEDRLGTGKPKGMFIAAIYEALGVNDYDPRDLMGRENVTKHHLAAILNRLASLDISERGDLTAEEWFVVREFGLGADVEWHIPEWVDSDDLYWTPKRERLFDYET